MALMVDCTATPYPTLYPSLENLGAHFHPIHPPEQKAQEEQEKEEEEEKEEAPVVPGEEQEEKLVAMEQNTTDAREATADAENLEQTTSEEGLPNGNLTCNSEENGTEIPQDKGHTDGTTDEGNLSLREEYVDRVWEEFVTHFLLGSCHIQKAAIFDLATRRPLAVNGNLRVSPEELEQLVISLQYLHLAYRNGVTLEGKTYKVRLADGRNGILARTEREGCTVCKTHTLFIIGVHDERGNSRKCNEDVMRLGDFFRKKAV